MELFLIGGHDLEMLEIIELLKQNKKNVKDKKLSWGAKLSDYEEELDFEGKIYGIELESDINPPQNYTLIDHHGENDHKPSSLEQIAKILNRELSREQKLIAANDSRYIGGMQALCATQEEIDRIRTQDRRAQGIQQEDEALALQSLEQSDSNIIFALTPYFSAISDVAYFQYDNYVIYNDEKIIFYGYNKKDVLSFLKQQNLDTSDYYYGGGDFGFVGIKESVLSKEQIQNAIKDFDLKQNHKDQGEIYSYHTFMFPFRFDYIEDEKKDFLDYCKEVSIDKRSEISDSFYKSLKKDGWEYQKFQVNENKFNYNEYAYFHPFIRDLFYNKDDNFTEKRASYYFEKDHKDGTFEIDTKHDKYSLELEGLSLRLFETGVAILTIEASNREKSQSDIDSILHINDFGRRVYVPFLGSKYGTNLSEAAKASQMPLSIKIKLKNEDTYEDNFCKEYKSVPNAIELSPYIKKLLGANTFSTTLQKEKYYIQPVLDDRMFVLSWYGNDEFSNSLSHDGFVKSNKSCISDKWYEYVFIDGDGKTIHNPKMQTELIQNATYERWMNHPDGTTLYGISRYSFVCVSNNSWFTKNILPLPHMKTMYFQMFSLLLAVRASVLKFSNETTVLSSIDEDSHELSDRISKLYKNYIKFVNKLYFREITAQEQGIEIYNKTLEIMKIDRDIKDLDNEIEELHSYVELIEEKERNDTLDFISKIGAVLLPPSLMAGVFGMNVLTFDATPYNEILAFWIIILSGFFGYFFIPNKKKKKKNILLKYKLHIVVLFIVLITLLTHFKEKTPEFKVNIVNESLKVKIIKENHE